MQNTFFVCCKFVVANDAIFVTNFEFHIKFFLRNESEAAQLPPFFILFFLVESTLYCDSLLYRLVEFNILLCQLAPIVRRPTVGEHQKVKLFCAVFVRSIKVTCRVGNVAFKLRA